MMKREKSPELLGIPMEKVRAVSKYVGRRLWRKRRHECTASCCSTCLVYKKKPVKVTLSRKESIMIHLRDMLWK